MGEAEGRFTPVIGICLKCSKGESFRLENLKPATTYLVKVKARNAVGLGPAFITSFSSTSVGEYLSR